MAMMASTSGALPAALRGDVAHERAIDLQRVDREMPQIGHRAVAGPEIVQRRGHPEFLQGFHRLADGTRIFDQSAFGELQLDHPRIDARSIDGARDAAHQAAVAKLNARDVYGDPPVGRLAVAPAAHLRASLAQHPVADLDDQSALFRQRYEFIRRYETALRMRPAQQRLDGLDAQVLEGEARLIME